MPGPEIAFNLASDGWRTAHGDAQALCRVAVCAVGREFPALNFSGWELGLTITDDPGIRILNRDHRGIDRPTDVLSFPLDAPAPGPDGHTGGRTGGHTGGLLGDIVLSDETVLRDAGGLGRAPADHLTHLVVHGMLHLLGFDHETRSEARRMEGLEIAILARLGIANPYSQPHISLEASEKDHA